MLLAAFHSQSDQIAAAALITFANWAASLQFWLLFHGASMTTGYIVVDAITAIAFYRMSRGKWFPAPLCFFHGLLVVYHVGTLIDKGGSFWEQFILNRTFDIELSYVIACALFRIAVMSRASRAEGA